METNPGPRRHVPDVCRILCGNVRGQAVNLSGLTVASSQYDILLCSETLVSDMRHVSEVLVSENGKKLRNVWRNNNGPKTLPCGSASKIYKNILYKVMNKIHF